MESISCYQLWSQVRNFAIILSFIVWNHSNITYFRANIESTHGREVEQIRREYSQEDKELIEKYLEAKRTANLKSEGPAKELEETEVLPGKLGMTDPPPFVSLSLSLSTTKYFIVHWHSSTLLQKRFWALPLKYVPINISCYTVIYTYL